MVEPGMTGDVAALAATLLADPHRGLHVYGFGVGALSYLTGAKQLSPEVRARLEGGRVLVVNALWFGRPHATHFNIEEAIEAARSVGAEQTYLTHLTHRVTHAELLARLPEGVAPAYDGLEI